MGPDNVKDDLSAPAKSIGAGLLVLLFLVPFATRISDIYVDPSDPGFGSRGFPRLVIWLGIALSLLLIGKAALALRAAGAPLGRLPRFREPVTILAVAGLYIWGITLFQYALPTMAMLTFLTWYFGNRGIMRVLVAPMIATGTYYFIFFILLGVYEEPGTLLSYDSFGFARDVRAFLGFY